jgi:hypothetical protein
MQNLDALKNALLTVGPPVSHYTAAKQPDKYIVWAEDGQGASVWSSNKRKLGVVTGTVDYFTKVENDSNVEKIETALGSIRIGWRLNSIQRETDTGYIHYEWAWEMI